MKQFIAFFFILLLSCISVLAADETCSITGNTCTTNVSIEENSPEVHTNSNALCIVYFYGDGCSKCGLLKPILDNIEKKYGDKIHIEKYEIYNHLDNYKLYNKYCSLQDITIEKRGIPFIAIDRKFFMGLQAIKDNLEPEIDKLLQTGIYVCPLGDEMTCHLNQNITISDSNPIIPNLKTGISMPLVLGTGLIDGINPCAFAVLIFLLTFLVSVSGNKRRMIKAGIAYTIAVYITYFLAGIGLLSVIQLTGLSHIILKIAAVLALLAALVNIKDFFWYGQGFSLKIPESKKSLIEKWTYRANVPAAIILGFLVSMFELPCTGGVYLAIIAMMANQLTRMQSIGYLLIYNVMFVLPLIVIILLITKGMKAEHIENWRQSKKTWMKLVMGLVMLALGLYMLLQ